MIQNKKSFESRKSVTPTTTRKNGFNIVTLTSVFSKIDVNKLMLTSTFLKTDVDPNYKLNPDIVILI